MYISQQINLADNVVDIVQYLDLEMHMHEYIEVMTRRNKREEMMDCWQRAIQRWDAKDARMESEGTIAWVGVCPLLGACMSNVENSRVSIVPFC